MHRAGAAERHPATELRPCHTEHVAQHPEQRRVGVDIDSVIRAPLTLIVKAMGCFSLGYRRRSGSTKRSGHQMLVIGRATWMIALRLNRLRNQRWMTFIFHRGDVVVAQSWGASHSSAVRDSEDVP